MHLVRAIDLIFIHKLAAAVQSFPSFIHVCFANLRANTRVMANKTGQTIVKQKRSKNTRVYKLVEGLYDYSTEINLFCSIDMHVCELYLNNVSIFYSYMAAFLIRCGWALLHVCENLFYCLTWRWLVWLPFLLCENHKENGANFCLNIAIRLKFIRRKRPLMTANARLLSDKILYQIIF